MYLELLAKTLTNSIYEDRLPTPSVLEVTALSEILLEIRSKGVHLDITAAELAQILQYTKAARNVHTYVSARALSNIESCIVDVKRTGVEGDLIDCGVLRGGTSIFMAGACRHYELDRLIYVADSFQGLPPPSVRESSFAREFWHEYADRLPEYNLQCLASKDDVVSNFSKYDLLSEKVKFIEGWFSQTLKSLPPSTKFSLVRIDVDWYQSTLDAITATYPFLSDGGYIIIDDYLLEGCKAAVDEYRETEGITAPIQLADEQNGVVFWQK